MVDKSGSKTAERAAMNEHPPEPSQWPAFWFEPWRWADAGWTAGYGATATVAHLSARRLLLAGWSDAFGLAHCWNGPGDARWLQLLSAAPSVLRDAAAVLGWIVVVRSPGGMAHARDAMRDRFCMRALRYRDVDGFEARIAWGPGGAPEARECGLHLLRLMAESHWPDIAPRLAMMRGPGALSSVPQVTIRRIAVARCLALWLAVIRWLQEAGQADSS